MVKATFPTFLAMKPLCTALSMDVFFDCIFREPSFHAIVVILIF